MSGLFKTSHPKPYTLNPRRGFSLVETIIYTGLLVLILVAVINMMLLMSHSYNYLKLSRHIQVSAVTALDRMVRDIRNAQSVDVGQSTLGTSPGILTLNTSTVSGTPQTVQFYVSGGGIRVKQDGVDIGPVTLPDVTLTNLVFRQITTGISQAVKIELTLSTGVGPAARSANFYGTAILRDSY
ncbi:MAG: hypothetical protein UX89_C0010G0014 [Parcubacteria group bacterium GW2011_GWA2_47_16]|nr:MAG: hypothetical protein UX89_C0010G0014 [Parcubacteria group bacterium GW2011_GWA2_47_16]